MPSSNKTVDEDKTARSNINTYLHACCTHAWPMVTRLTHCMGMYAAETWPYQQILQGKLFSAFF